MIHLKRVLFGIGCLAAVVLGLAVIYFGTTWLLLGPVLYGDSATPWWLGTHAFCLSWLVYSIGRKEYP